MTDAQPNAILSLKPDKPVRHLEVFFILRFHCVSKEKETWEGERVTARGKIGQWLEREINSSARRLSKRLEKTKHAEAFSSSLKHHGQDFSCDFSGDIRFK